MTAEILWNSSMILRLNGRQGQGKRSLEARADAFSRLKNLDKKGALVAQLQCYLAKIEMATMPAPSVVRTMNYALQDARTKKNRRFVE